MGDSSRHAGELISTSIGASSCRGRRMWSNQHRFGVISRPYSRPLTRRESISFGVDLPYLTDRQLQLLVTKGDELALAKVLRDLNVVLSTHVTTSKTLTSLVSSKSPSKKLTGNYSPYNPDKAIIDLITNLGYLLSTPSRLNCNAYEEIDAEDDASAFHSVDLNERVVWPPTVGVTGFRSILCTTCAAIQPTVWKHMLEVADYCIAPRDLPGVPLPLYHDGWKLSIIRLEEFQTFEPDRMISPHILTAWCRILNCSWKDGNYRTASLPFMDLDDRNFSFESLHEMWQYWVHACDFDFSATDLIYIPFRTCGRYGITLVNFKEKLLHHFGLGLEIEDPKWLECVSRHVDNGFWKFQLRMGDTRSIRLYNFTDHFVTPPWGTSISANDSGIAVMILMELGCNVTVDVHEADLRITKRVSFCSRIISSTTNNERVRFIEALGANIHAKVTG